jgi:hypothetical protein
MNRHIIEKIGNRTVIFFLKFLIFFVYIIFFLFLPITAIFATIGLIEYCGIIFFLQQIPAPHILSILDLNNHINANNMPSVEIANILINIIMYIIFTIAGIITLIGISKVDEERQIRKWDRLSPEKQKEILSYWDSIDYKSPRQRF